MKLSAILYFAYMSWFILFEFWVLGWFFFCRGGIVDSLKEDLRDIRRRHKDVNP